jgi:hypothetical protein
MRLLMWVLLAATAVVAGCTSDGSDQGRPPAEDAAELGEIRVLGPGTELTAGFIVPQGAELMTWPTGDWFSSDVDPVWKASMLVTGDPIEVFNALAAQATELGFDVVDQDCRTLDDGAPVSSVDCFTDGYRLGAGAESERVNLSVSVRDDALPVAMVGIGIIATERVSEFGDGPWQLRRFVPKAASGAATDVQLRPSDIDTGDRLVDGDWQRTTLVADSRLVASAAGSTCAAGMTAVVHVDGVPDDVFDAYARQLFSGDQGDGPPEEMVSDVLGRRVRTVAGGSDAYVRMTMVVGREGEPTRLFIEQRCAD